MNTFVKTRNLSETADKIIKKISECSDPFSPITLVFHSTKVEQWFKAYFLKHSKEILMNVECTTLASFVNEIVNSDNKHHILEDSEYIEYVMKALLTTKLDFPEKCYYRNGDNINGGNLFDFAGKLATVLFNMEFDHEEISAGWQREIYDEANRIAEADGCFTPRRMYLKNKQNLKEIKGEVYVLNNSFITDLYLEILDSAEACITIYSQDDGAFEDLPTVELYAAPSKMREVERLHTDICKKLEDRQTTVSDFIVYVPNVNDYANTIHRVFKKSKSGFPAVPYRIIGENIEKHDIEVVLDTLYDIANKGFFTRYDLQKYITNPMIKRILTLSDDDVAAFMKTVNETNTRRNADTADDWERLEKRLLTSLLSDGKTLLKDEKSLIYSSIEMDLHRINKLIDIVNALRDWANLFKGDLSAKRLLKTDIYNIIEKLDRLLSYRNKYDEEKNYLYLEVKEECEKIGRIFDDIPAITFLLMLLESPTRFSKSAADIFTCGVTFLGLDTNNIVSGKHVYVLGLSSKQFPRIEIKNEIDYSKNHRSTYELDKQAFKNVLKNSDNVSVSFVNRDLKNDEEMYPSMVIPSDILEEYDKSKNNNPYKKSHILSIDENRELKDLYTYRGILNKKRITAFGTENVRPESPLKNSGKVIPKITTRKIKQYLENTIVFKYLEVLKKSNDDETKSKEYELIDVDKLEKFNILKEIILTGIKASDEWSSVVQPRKIEEMKLRNLLPKELEEDYFTYCYENLAKSVIEEIRNGYEKVGMYSVDIMDSHGDKRVFEVNTECFCKECDSEIFFTEPRVYEKADNKYFLPLYACALVYVANKKDDIDYSVILKAQSEKKFTLNSSKAKDILNKLALNMEDTESIKYMDIGMLYEIKNQNNNDDPKIDIEWLKTRAEKSNMYFNDYKILNPAVDFGYDETTFSQSLQEEYDKISKLILYFKDGEE